MEDVKTGLAGRILWAMAAVLLLMVWIVSMPLDDDRLCATAPLGFAYAAVVLLGVVGMVAGARPARPTLTFLFGLGAGLYFLIRCLGGDMLSEIARELPLILTAFVFYGAGYLLAPCQRGGMALMGMLVMGIVANVVYFFLLRDPEFPLEWSGRPSMSLAGFNEKREGRTLFTYCNFATLFLMVSGVVLICRPLWVGWKSWNVFFAALVGMVGMVVSCLCTGRSVLALPVLMLIAAWMLWAMIRLYTGKGVGYGVVIPGILLMMALLVMLAELFLGDALMEMILSVDTNGRTLIWSYIYHILPQVPWYGHGAGATQWQLVPFIDTTSMPNYAHNDYLQAWVDYGVVGFALVAGVILAHLASGFWSMASEEIPRARRALVAACMLLLLSLAGCAVYEFVWHNVALVGLTALACGVLAAPVPSRREPLFRQRKWARGYQPPLRPVRPMGRSLTALSCAACLLLAAGCAGFGWRLLPAWKAQWEYNALYHAGASDAQRVVFLERVMEFYPDPELVDHYVTLWPPAERADNLARKEKMMRMALASNPHHLYVVVMLADLLGRADRPAEAEELLREEYSRRAAGGLPGTALANWPAYYGMNLLVWGQQKMAEGDNATALSMMEYALNLWGHTGGFYRLVSSERRRAENAYIAARRVDVDTLRAIGVQPDDSWMQPLHPGGPSALYEQWGRDPSSRKYTNPYAKRTPLKF